MLVMKLLNAGALHSRFGNIMLPQRLLEESHEPRKKNLVVLGMFRGLYYRLKKGGL